MRHPFPLAALLTGAILASGAVAGCAQGGSGLLPDPREMDGGPMDAASSSSDAGPCGVDCSAIDTPPCMTSVCNEGLFAGPIGECVMQPMVDGTACDDGDFCTVDDTCTAGVCTGAPNDCADAMTNECQEAVCDAAAGACVVRPLAAMNGAPCTTDDRCLSGTTCSNGVCQGTPTDCSALPVPNECQTAICNPATGGCILSSANEGGACTDPADPCTVGSICTGGVCGGGTTPGCSMTRDGCCPSTCTAANDADCACPGEFIGGTCVYLPGTAAASDQADARAQCAALGTGWDLCSPSLLCDTAGAVTRYLAGAGCACGGGAATCACGSAANIYVHVSGARSPYYVRGPDFPDCISGTSCTDSVSESCGVALCCR